MADEKGKKLVLTTTLEQDKTCKSSVRFRSPKGTDDKVTTSLYLQNASYDKLGKPNTVKVSVTRAVSE